MTCYFVLKALLTRVAESTLALVIFALIAGASATQAKADGDNIWAGGDVAHGQQIFAGNGCGWCHEGSGRRAGRGPQLMNTERTDQFLADRIASGSPGRMPAFGQSIDVDKIKDLIAFIHSLKPLDGK
jgi:mono/diheme cytochrome c family protein